MIPRLVSRALQQGKCRNGQGQSLRRATRASSKCFSTDKPSAPAGWRIVWESMIKNVGLNGVLGIELEKVDESSKAVTMTMHVKPDVMSAMGKVHGGAMSTLTDTAIGYGCYLNKAKGAKGFAVIESNLNFLGSAQVGDVISCTAYPHKTGGLTQVWEAEVKILSSASAPERAGERLAIARTTAVNLHDRTQSHDHSHPEPVTMPTPATKPKPKTEQPTAPSNSSKLSPDEFVAANKTTLGTKFNVDSMTKEEIASKFDSHSENWETLVHHSKYEPVFAWIKDKCSEIRDKDARILDLACAVGLVGKALREGGLTGDITGVDISSNMVDKALRSGNYVDGIVHDLDNDIAIPNTVFDLVVCTGATEMLKDPRRFLLEVYRVLKREGQAWISFQHADPEFDNPLAHQGMKQYEPEYLQKLFRECGFLVRSEKILPAAYYMPDPSGNGKLRPVPFSIWQLIRV